MVIFLYLAVVIAALYWVSKMLLPEMAKPPLPRGRVVGEPKSFDAAEIIDPNAKFKKLEMMLVEKNKNINILQTELKIFHIQVRESDKLKSLLEDEIHRLREQNRIFRSELGLPAAQTIVQSAENLII
jgi:hypothetical protein